MSEGATSLRARLGLGAGPFSNPIVARELLTILRDPRGFALALLAVGVPTVVTLMLWPDEARGVAGQGALARQMFAVFQASQLAIVALLVPPVLGPALTLEKEKDTLDLLHTTPLSGDAILLGKLISGVGYLVLLIAVAVPLLSLTGLLGGVQLEGTLVLYATAVTHAAVFGLASILISSLARRTLTAVVLSYAATAALAFVLWPLVEAPGATLVVGGSISLVLYTLARHTVRRPYNPVPPPPQEPELGPTEIGLVLRHDAFPDKLILPPPRIDVLPDGVDPIEVKELAAGIHGAGSRFVRALIWIGLLGGLGTLFYTLGSSAFSERGGGVLLAPSYAPCCFVAAFAGLLGAAIGARAFSGERDEGTNEMLVLTILPRWRLVWGKYKAHLRVVVTLIALDCVPLLPFFLSQWRALWLVVLIVVLVSTTTTALAVGFFFSLRAKSTTGAMFRSLVTLFGLWVGPVLLAGLGTRLDLAADLLLRLASPFQAAALPLRSNDLLYSLAALSLHVILWGGLSAGVLLYCTRRFDEVMNSAAER